MLRNREIAWDRIAAEGVAIVISILLAFSIQAWWEDRNERIDELEVLTALQVELKQNVGLMADELWFRCAMVESITELPGGRIVSAPDYEFSVVVSNGQQDKKARILLMLALTRTSELDEIQRIFDTY